MSDQKAADDKEGLYPESSPNKIYPEGNIGNEADQGPFMWAATTIRTEIARKPSSEGMFLEPVSILKILPPEKKELKAL